LRIRIYYDDIKYRLRKSKRALSIIKKVIMDEKKIPGDLYYIITNDKEMLKINKEFLNRDTLTDVIAFDYSEEEKIDGEIYISKDTVKRNANDYKVSLREEILRVMIHGALHLCGYNDKNEAEKRIMRKKENEWIEIEKSEKEL
jgi:probable rRNA maturation factor